MPSSFMLATTIATFVIAKSSAAESGADPLQWTPMGVGVEGKNICPESRFIYLHTPKMKATWREKRKAKVETAHHHR